MSYRSTEPSLALCRHPVARQGLSSTNSRTKYTKKRVISTPSGHIAIPVRDMFTKPFVCLANKDQTMPPSVQEKLGLAQLGERKVVFERDSDSRHVHEKLLDEFPQLPIVEGMKFFVQTLVRKS